MIHKASSRPKIVNLELSWPTIKRTIRNEGVDIVKVAHQLKVAGKLYAITTALVCDVHIIIRAKYLQVIN